MRISSFLGAVAFSASVAVASVAGSSAALADSGAVRINIVKGGFFVGASGGDGVLRFRGRNYPLSIGGLSAGLVFGASQANLRGRVTNIRRASDVAGVYGAVGAGGAVGVGAGAIVLQNNKGAVLRLEGRQVGLIANVDLSGLSISLR
ncbi:MULTISPECIES: hypothetical protein [unclassified Beijerinckia]|uniref:hypothetical protein n=1 Tax=unclassified Beijerinckia TaxID=2638183 RepID=UPI000898EFB7|nr:MULTISPECIES: hypothetical protein [unclassified Beijerinckia]MDH7797611.1 hypothetical protein [Beijerinckia sp. GAS462]SEC92289.1 hypothetical protein SAMN05443249_3903 [Beijerinckia sp. 28-YEA-48]